MRSSSPFSTKQMPATKPQGDVLEEIWIQAKRRRVDYRVAKSVNDGIRANKDPQATGFCYRISVQGCH